jgi:outer membrane protein
MKKIIVLALFAMMFTAGNAQQKFGYLNTQELIIQMPEYAEAQKKHEKFQSEQQQKYQSMIASYQAKEAEYTNGAATLTQTEKTMLETELQTLGGQIQEFEQALPQIIQGHQNELIGAIVVKVQNAAKAVGEEKGFIYIFDTSVLLYDGGGENVSSYVKNKLGIL